MDWVKFFGIKNPNKCRELSYRQVIDTIDKICPERTFKLNSNREERMNTDILERIIDKDNALKKSKK